MRKLACYAEPGFDLNVERHVYKTASYRDLPPLCLESQEYFEDIRTLPKNVVDWLKHVKLDDKAEELLIGYDNSNRVLARFGQGQLVIPVNGKLSDYCFKLDFRSKVGRPASNWQAYAVVKFLNEKLIGEDNDENNTTERRIVDED